MVLIYCCVFLSACYGVLMMLYLAGWSKQPTFIIQKDHTPVTTISVVIAARNEEHNIGSCIEAIRAQEYPDNLLQVVVVDDHSTDNTAGVVKRYGSDRVKYINLREHLDSDDTIIAYKKKALATGIAHSSGHLIVTTDADCIPPKQWLLHIAQLYEKEMPVMIVAPVDLTNNNSIVEVFQSLDFMSMQGITAASHFMNMGNMSNGANLAFSRDAYEHVGGYAGIDHLASGDDYLLMMKLQKVYSGRIAYLKSPLAIVPTPPQHDWAGFYRQRVRWASKSGKYDDKKMTTVLSFVYLYDLSLVVLAVASIFSKGCVMALAACLLVKVIAELIYLYPVARFFNKRRQLWIFPFLQPLHILYIVLVGLAGFMGDYEWKGRTVK